MKNIINRLRGFILGIKTTIPYVIEIQEEWQARVLNGTETYESFWSWQKGYSLAHYLRKKF